MESPLCNTIRYEWVSAVEIPVQDHITLSALLALVVLEILFKTGWFELEESAVGIPAAAAREAVGEEDGNLVDRPHGANADHIFFLWSNNGQCWTTWP